jgi:hypothetical protein
VPPRLFSHDRHRQHHGCAAGNHRRCQRPSPDDGIIVLSNQFGSRLNEHVRLRLLELLYQQEPEYDEQVQLSVAQTKQALARLREQLTDSVDADAVVPYLGTCTNNALGEIIVEFQDDVLTLDAGEFQVELLPRMGEDGKVIAYRSVTPGFLSTEFRFSEDDDGNPIIVRGGGVYEYSFEKVSSV